ncbi:hypothetical protein [Symbioplanes lichenis]|uniref:hypothetical protein n=1 Tax=Symbioplanes lichenis TaxID=1629072 RepID=UPI00273869F4|nr:hypothetical protein [Actinoplanes lichenis]
MAGERNSGWSRPWAAFFSLIIILGGVAVSFGFGVRLRGALERSAQARLAASSAAVQTTVVNELGRYSDAVRLTAAALTALPEPTAGAFSKLAAAVDAQELTAVRALSLVVPDSPGLTTRWRARGATGFTKQPGPAGLREHLYPVFTAGLADQKAPPVGADQGAAQAVVDVTKVAAKEKTIAISDAYVRLDGTDKQLSFDVVAPVTGAEGFLVLNVAARDLIATGLSLATAGNDLDVQLLTRSGSGELAEVAAVVRNGNAAFRYTSNFSAGERQWVLRSGASYQALLPNAGRTDMVVVIAGATLATMFGILMYLQMSATARADREIAAEVAEQLDRSLGAQQALVGSFLTPPGAEPPEIDLAALVRELSDVTPGDLPHVRADPAPLRHLVATMLSAVPGEDATVTATTAEDGTVRLTVANAETTITVPLQPAAVVEAVAGPADS